MKLTINEIYQMTKICVDRLLNEAISMANAYSRFYAGKISQDLWAKITEGIPNMTPFHKKLLDIILTDTTANEALINSLAELANKLWREKPELKNRLINDIATCSRVSDALAILNYASAASPKDIEGQADKGLVKVLENDKLLITCTTSYSASHKYYKHTHWCTASGVDGEFDGFGMFIKYTKRADDGEAILIQLVDKNNQENAYQLQVYRDDGHYLGDIRDIKDVFVSEENMVNIMSNYGIDLLSVIKKINVDKLYNATETNINKEYDYWSEKSEKYLEKAKNELIKFTNSDILFKAVLGKKGIINVGPELEPLANTGIRTLNCTLDCGNKVIEISLDAYVNYEAAVKSGVMSEHAKNYLIRLSMVDDEADYDFDWSANYIVYLVDSSGKILAKYFRGRVGSLTNNIVGLNILDKYEEVESTILINGNTGGKIDVDEDECWHYRSKDNNTMYVLNRKNELSYEINKITCEVVDHTKDNPRTKMPFNFFDY